MQKETFSIDVVPLVRIALSRDQTFTYLSFENLPNGSLVDIPLGKRRVVQGIVTRSFLQSELTSPPSKIQICTHKRERSLKFVHSLLSPALLTENQIQLARSIAQNYFVPLGIALKMFLPPDLKKRNTPLETEVETIETVSFTPDQKQASHAILKAKGLVFLTGPASSGKTEVLIDVTRKILQEKKQVLFLLPEIALTSHTIDRLEKRLGKTSVFVFHSALTKKKQSETWQQITSGIPGVIVGSRGALFLPFQKLGLVVLDEEHDDSYKQTLKSPRYDTRRVAEALALLHEATTVLSSATPRGETWWRVDQKRIPAITLPPLLEEAGNSARSKTPTEKEGKSLSLRTADPLIRVVDMRLAHWKSKQKNKTPPIISDELKELLFDTIRNKEQVLLLVSRQGMNAFSICSHCKNIFRCPKCDRALVPQRSGHFLCLGGHFRTQAFPKCPTCGGLQFVGHGIGTQKVEEEIRRIFQYARIARLDSQSFKKRAFRESIFRDMTEKKVDILIGTQMVAKGWDIPHLSLIGILDTDAFFSFPDFSTDLRATQLLFQAKGRLGRVGNTRAGTLLIQTYHAERPALLSLLKNDYFSFLKTELETREALKYPPYGTLLRLVGKSTDDTALRAQGLALYKSLVGIAPETVLVSRPAKSVKRQKFGWFCRHIVIKNTESEISETVQTTLENIPKNWYVDRDPISIA